MKNLLLFFLLLSIGEYVRAAQPSNIYLTVGYCPTDSSSEGAVVSVDIKTGNWTIVSTFQWPTEIFGCLALYDPTVTFDYSSDELYFDFTSDFGMLTVVDIPMAKNVRHVDCTDPFFVGFDNMAVDKSVLKGTTPTVTQSGYCSDGCFEFGTLNTKSGAHNKLKNLPFKATMDDSHLLEDSIFWIQASYDLRPEEQQCAPDDTDLCLLTIDSSTGDLKDAIYTNFSIYKYTPYSSSERAVAFLEGFDDICKHPYNNYLFANVDLKSAKANPIACIPKNIVIREDEWISSFSHDETLFGTGSAFGGEGQVLIFNVHDASVKTNAALSGLGQKLKAFDNLYWIWNVNFPKGD